MVHLVDLSKHECGLSGMGSSNLNLCKSQAGNITQGDRQRWGLWHIGTHSLSQRCGHQQLKDAGLPPPESLTYKEVSKPYLYMRCLNTEHYSWTEQITSASQSQLPPTPITDHDRAPQCLLQGHRTKPLLTLELMFPRRAAPGCY